MNPQTALSTPRSRPESPRRLRWRLLALSLTPVLVAGLGATALAEPAESTVSRLQLAVDDAVQLAPGLTLREFTASGPIRGAVLAADLTEATLEPTYLYSGAVADSAPVSDHLASAGAVAGVNGDFFDIGNTDAPLGVGVDGGQPVNGPADGWNDAMTVAGDAAQLDRVLLDGVVTTPSGDVTATNLNSPDVADSGVGVYTSAWGEADRAGVVDGAGSVVEIEVTDGKASRVDDSAGSGPIAENAQIVIGRDAGADALSDVAVGDPVEVDYKLAGEGDAIDVAVGGNVVILRDGEVVAPDNPLHPRTAAGVDAAGTTLYLAVVDGRSSLSVGMNYVDLAELMKSFGADDAINLDGGGSTTMAVHNGEAPTVVNQPSDGQQRSVPNGIGFASTAACPLVDRDFAAYPDLAADAEGPEVRGAQCLLGDAGFRPADAEPTGVIDPDTAAQVEALQTDRGLEATGEIDPATWTALLSSGATPTLQNGDRGSAVIRLQRTLTAALGQELPIDGIFGDDVEAAVRDYQSSRGLGVDGVAGAETWEAMQAGS